jgi:glycosyltransferase involved in cell wall biosynthesis
MTMRIGLCHYIIGGTDGVSLEMAKWRRVLEALGHRVAWCAGELHREPGTRIPELSLYHPQVQRLQRWAFTLLRGGRESALEATVERLATSIARQLENFIDREGIDLLIVDNIWSLGAHPAAALAFWRVARGRSLSAVGHHHDFYWERPLLYRPTCAYIERLLEEYHPPRDGLLRHVVINSLAQEELRRRRGIESAVVPNVFDFDRTPPPRDMFNADFREALGLSERDIVLLQATRVVRRKGIELAIDFAQALGRRRHELERLGRYDGRPFTGRDRIVLLLANTVDDRLYLRQLLEKSRKANVEMIVASERIAYQRSEGPQGKIYAFWDAYAHADLVTYPSLWEGFGNQLLEAIWTRLPVVLYEYPVYRADIGPRGFRVISLGDALAGEDEHGLVHLPSEILDRAAREAVSVLTDREARAGVTDWNLRAASRHYSPQALERRLSAEVMNALTIEER